MMPFRAGEQHVGPLTATDCRRHEDASHREASYTLRGRRMRPLSTVDHSISIFTRKRAAPTVNEGRADLLRKQAGSSGSPRISNRVSDANLVKLLAEKMDQAPRNIRAFRSA